MCIRDRHTGIEHIVLEAVHETISFFEKLARVESSVPLFPSCQTLASRIDPNKEVDDLRQPASHLDSLNLIALKDGAVLWLSLIHI